MRRPERMTVAGVSLQPVSTLDHERLWSPIQVAAYLGVPVRTLYAWRYRGEGPLAVRVGKHLRYRRADIDRWLEGRR